MSFRARRAILALGALIAVAVASAWGFFAGVRAVFGEEIGAGYHGPAVTLCALNRDGSSGVIIAGDSRAKTQIDPYVIEARSGIKAINAAESFPFGGDITTFVNSLRANPEALASSPIIILSLSLQGVNDFHLESLPMAGVWNWSARHHARLLARIPGRYLSWFGGKYLPALWRESGHVRRGKAFACTEEVGLPPAQSAARGFRPNYGLSQRPRTPDSAGWMIDNGGWQALLDALAWLERSPARAIVLMDAPNHAEWTEAALGPDWPAWQARFDRELATVAAGRGKIRFLDLTAAPALGLEESQFFDMYHLNSSGAEKFSVWLGDWLSREFPTQASR